METEKLTMNEELTAEKVQNMSTASSHEKKESEKVGRDKENSEMIPSNIDFKSLNLFTEDGIAAATHLLTLMMRSKKGGIENVNDGIAILLRAKDLGLPFTTCIEHIHVVNGKTGVDIHIIKALLLKAGCTWKCTKDYQPLYEYTDGFSCFAENLLPPYAVKCVSQKEAESKAEEDTDGERIYVYPVLYYQDFNGNVYKSYQWHSKFKLVLNKKQAKTATDEGLVPVFRIPNKPVDYLTEFKLTRNVNGRIMETTSRFSYTDALQAGFLEKDTYVKYTRTMISHRAFTLGARDIAADIIMGVMSTDELKMVNGMNLDDKDVSDAEFVEM